MALSTVPVAPSVGGGGGQSEIGGDGIKKLISEYTFGSITLV